MLKETCLVPDCGKPFETEASLHRHLKAHKLRLADYYQTFTPRYDKGDGSLIEFKNKQQYFSTDFNSRETMKRWLMHTNSSVTKAYCKQLLISRKEKKNIIWAPTQIELRTTMMPPIQFYHDLFGDYYELCAELGFKNKFSSRSSFDLGIFIRDYKIFVDTREQLPLSFNSHASERHTLKFGDYACSNHDITCKCYIERKSPQDFVGTFSGGYERFCREVERALEAQAYLIVVVESPLETCMHFQDSENFYHKNTKVTPEFIFHNVRELIQKYENLQFLFVDGRIRAAQVIEEIFDSQCTYKTVDLQLMHDTGLL